MISHSSETNIHSVGLEDNRHLKDEGWNSARSLLSMPSTSSSVGTLRLYSPSGDESRLLTVLMEATVEEVCSQLGADCIFLQIGNNHSKALPSSVSPLRVVVDILDTLGYSSVSQSIALSPQPFLKHIFALYLGQPHKRDGQTELVRGKGWIRKGRMVKRWTRADCLLYNHTIRISKGEEDDIILLGGARVDRHMTKRGEALRIDTPSTQFCLLFDDPSSLHAWITGCRRSEVTSRCDFSSLGLHLVPDHIFSSRGRSVLTHLNLRRNSLLIRANSLSASPAPLLGWVEDIGRLTLLQHLDLSSNRLGSFPPPLSQLSHLTRLSLAGNQLDAVPIHIRLLVNLNSLDLSNNWLSDLPFQLTECTHLTQLNLSFNRFKQIPHTLHQLKGVTEWKLAGNELTSVHLPSEILQRIEKLDLRRNSLSRTFRVPSPTGDQLGEIDLRDNPSLSTIQLMNLSSLRILRADRLQLTHLEVNGSSLTHLHVSFNLLESLIVMPIPQSLHSLDVSHNRLSNLPEWFSDLSSLEHLDASHNLLSSLPSRLLSAASLRSLHLHRNQLTAIDSLGGVISSVELVDLHSNQLDRLPVDFFIGTKRLRDLNVSGNLLSSLPAPPPSHRLRSLKASFNLLNESIIPLVCSFRSLVTLHLAHNKIHFFDDSCLRELRLLEEVNLSSNSLSSLSLSIPSLPALRVLRAHSNQLETLPNLANSRSLTVIDVSNNRLSRVDTGRCSGSTLRQLDLTCNTHLTFHPDSLSTQDHRPLSFVRLNQLNPFSYGFSQSAGNRNKLCIQQILPPLDSSSSLFGMVDGGANAIIAHQISKVLGGICSSECISTPNSLSQSILQTHLSIGSMGERLGANVLLCLLLDSSLHIASSGSIGVCLLSSSSALSHLLPTVEIDGSEYTRVRHGGCILDENNRIDGVTAHPRQIGLTYLFPSVVPSPVTVSVQISTDAQYLVIANDSIWRVLSDDVIISILSESTNPHVAAKSLQDAAEAFGCAGNASIIVIRLSPVCSFSSVSARSVDKGLLDSHTVAVEGEETKLKAIEERLERISQVIASIDSPPTVSPCSLPFSPPPLPISSPPLYSSSSLYHRGPRGSLHSTLKEIPSSSPSFTRLSLSTSPSLKWEDPLAHLPDHSSTVSYRNSSPAPSQPPPDPSRARFHAARSALQDNLRLNPPDNY